MSKNVALALASGGPRGFAFIGAIEELLDRGYNITSVAGTSAGSLIGGIYAAGGLQAFKEWLFGIDTVKIMSLMDFSMSMDSLVKGQKLMKTIKQRVPEVNIEDLPIPFAAVATDLYTGEEVVLRKGSLFDAIRASISIPSMFRPAVIDGRTLVDGGMVNTFPLNRVQRTPGDILVGFNVNQIDAAEIQGFLDSRAAISESKSTKSFIGRIEAALQEYRLVADGKEERLPVDVGQNMVKILQRSFGIMNCTIARMGIELNPPDILVDMPFDSYHGVYGYSHAPEIVERGRALMADALDKYEKDHA
ncbi:MAG: patatin-like phospholipase family protein [Bacteroidales bacterium]|nr:patatin-like phospholipase family protein [Bacteroidales bacterium]